MRLTDVEINNLNVTLLLSANSLVLIYPISGMVVLSMLLCLAVFAFTVKRVPKTHVSIYCIGIFLFVLAFLLNGFGHESINDYFIRFLIMGAAGLFVATSEFSPFSVIKYTCVLSYFIYPFLLTKDLHMTGDADFNYMGITYALLKLMICLMATVFFINNERKYRLLNLIVLCLYLALYFLFAERGAYVSILAFIFLSFCIHKNLSIYLVLLFIPLLFLLPSSFESVILGLESLLNSIGVSIFAVSKFAFLLNEGIDNGRFDIWGDGIRLIQDSPFIGNGIGAYEVLHEEGYVHNVFLQIAIEGGMIFLIPFLLLVIYAVKRVFDRNEDCEVRVFLAFLLSSVMMPLCFSNTFWTQQQFWFLIGYLIVLYNERALQGQSGIIQFVNDIAVRIAVWFDRKENKEIHKI